MIFYVTAINPETHDEWVMSTHDTKIAANNGVILHHENDDRFEYRVYTVDGKTGHTPPTYADTDSLRTESGPRVKDFTLAELYGWYDGKNASTLLKECSECGAAISDMEVHRTWHNKLLP